MKLATLLLTGVLALGTGLSGAAMAHGGRDWDRGKWDDHPRHHVHRHKHHHHDRYRWRHDYRPYRHDYRVPYGDSWYGIHLFFGGR